MVLPPHGGVLGFDPEIVSENLRGHCRRGEPDHGACAVLGLPGAAERVHRGGLARPSRANEHVEHPPGHRDPCQRLGLILTQHQSVSVGLACYPRDGGEGDGWAGEVAGAFEEPVFRSELHLGGEDGGVDRPEHRRAIATPEHHRR